MISFKSKSFFLVSFFILFFLSTFFYVKIFGKSKKNYWIDGRNIGKEINSNEKDILNIVRSSVKVFFKDSLSKEESLIFNKMNAKFLSEVKASRPFDYKKEFQELDEKNIVKKIFKWRRDFRARLSKEERKNLNFALSKLSLEEKIELTGGLLIP